MKKLGHLGSRFCAVLISGKLPEVSSGPDWPESIKCVIDKSKGYDFVIKEAARCTMVP